MSRVSRPLYATVTASHPDGSPITHQSGAASVARCRAPLLEGDSSSTAPTTVTRTPGIGCVAAAMNAASGPFASTAPRPTSSSPSILTGISPGTVSMCPSRTTWTGPSPISPTALPASSTLARKPRSPIRAASHSTASPSRRETLGISTRPRTSARSAGSSATAVSAGSSASAGSPERFAARGQDPVDLGLGDNERRQEADHGRAGPEREDALVLQGAQRARGVLLELNADEQAEPADLANAIAPDRAQPAD